MKRFIVVLAMLVCAGCRYNGIDYSPKPGNIKNNEEAKAIIFKTFSEQPRSIGVTQLKVDDVGVSFVENKRSLTSLNSLSSGVKIYYTRPDRFQLSRHKSSVTCNVSLWKNKIKIYKVFCFSEKSGKLFIDAFKFMQDYNSAKDPELRQKTPAETVPVKTEKTLPKAE